MTVYRAELADADNFIGIYDADGEKVDGGWYEADPSRTFFDMTEEERQREGRPLAKPEAEASRSVEEYEELIGRPILPYDEWLPDHYDECLAAWGWKRMSEWSDHSCTVEKAAK